MRMGLGERHYYIVFAAQPPPLSHKKNDRGKEEGASEVSHRAEAWRNKAHSRTNMKNLHSQIKALCKVKFVP